MITSMTGFGSANADQSGISCAIEIRAVNNRFFKAVIKLPDKLTALEPDIDRLLRDALARGSLVVIVSVKDQVSTACIKVNSAVLDIYIEQMKVARAKLLQAFPSGSAPPVTDLAQLLLLPGVVEVGEDTAEYLATHRDLVLRLVAEATAHLNDMRRREGAALDLDLTKHLEIIRRALAQISTLAPTVTRQYHEKLRARVLQMVSDAKLSLSDSDLLKEVALFTDRADISEEIARLSGHLDQFQSVCQKENQAGRKLDFIAQEMLREANTIASKANDAGISKLTVDIKSAIDRIKEQVQNVE